MNKKVTKQKKDNSTGAVSVGISYASVLKKALKMLGVFLISMIDEMKKDNQGSRKPFGLATGSTAGKHLAGALMSLREPPAWNTVIRMLSADWMLRHCS